MYESNKDIKRKDPWTEAVRLILLDEFKYYKNKNTQENLRKIETVKNANEDTLCDILDQLKISVKLEIGIIK